nr:formin-like protein 5 isoform X1 [Camelus dromedarius]
MSVCHFGEQKGKGSSSDKEEGATEPEIKNPECKKKNKKRKKKPEYVTGTVEVAPEELTDHNTRTSVGGANRAYTLADAGPGAAPVWPGSARPPAADPEAQVTVDSRDPGTSPGPPGVPHRMGRPASLLRGYSPPPPPPPLWPLRSQPPPPPLPLVTALENMTIRQVKWLRGDTHTGVHHEPPGSWLMMEVDT